jgi:AbrB family looped-hinge helix DNA binding protein
MTLVRVRDRAQITIPQEARDALNVKKGDYFEAEVVEGKLVLKPVSVTEREGARERLLAMLQGSRFLGPGPEPTDDELMQEVVAAIKETRRKRREGDR